MHLCKTNHRVFDNFKSLLSSTLKNAWNSCNIAQLFELPEVYVTIPRIKFSHDSRSSSQALLASADEWQIQYNLM